MIFRDRIKELRRVSARDLRVNPHNWRRHSKAQAAALEAMLKEVGFAGALLARETDDGGLQLIDGHLRAGIADDERVPVLVLDIDEVEAKKLLLTYDPIASMAEADADALKSLMAEWQSDNPAIQALLENTVKEYNGLLNDDGSLKDPEPQIEKAEKLRQKWGVVPGQLWEIDRHRIFCGDARYPPNQLFAGHKIRLIWTDPPYGVDYGAKNEFLNTISRGNRIQKPMSNDQLASAQIRALITAALRVAAFYSEPGAGIYLAAPSGPLHIEFIIALSEAGFTYKHQLVWVKQQFVIGRSDYHYRHEPILYGWRENGPHLWTGNGSQDSVFEIPKPHISDLHPTTKPVKLIAGMIINSSNFGDLIYDPFLGSGSTILAAHQLNRIGCGCEIDPGYCAVTLERLSNLGLTPKLPDGSTP